MPKKRIERQESKASAVELTEEELGDAQGGGLTVKVEKSAFKWATLNLKGKTREIGSEGEE